MKRNTQVAILCLTALSCFILGCQEKEDYSQEIEEYEFKIETSLQQLNTELARLKNEAESAGLELRLEKERQIAILTGKREAVEERLRLLWHVTEEEWGGLKEEIDQQLADLDDFLRSTTMSAALN